MINDEVDEVIKELLISLQNRYQNNLEKLMKDSEFAFSDAHVLYCKCHKVNPNHVGSYVDSLGWIKAKKPEINPIR